MRRPVTGSRQSGAIIAAGVSTNGRIRSATWGIARLSSAHIPPDHIRISRSSVRACHALPRRTRPKWCSMLCKRASNSGGDKGVEIIAAALANRRCDGPIGALEIIAECANTSMSSISSAATACSIIWAGLPISGWRWFDPRPIRYRLGRLHVLDQAPVKLRSAVAEEAHAGAVDAGLVEVERGDH
jgi:hypothetical protein